MKWFVMLIVALLMSCDSVGTQKGTEKEIEITIQSVESLNLDHDSKIKFSLYGYDTELADQAATLLQEYTFTLEKVPKQLVIDFDPALNSKIKPTPRGAIGYYFTVYVDIDNNGVIDSSDAIKDYDRSPETFHGANIESLSTDIYIMKNTATNSEKF